MGEGAHIVQKRASDPFKLESQVAVSHLMWVLVTKLEPYVGVTRTLHS